MRDHSKGDGVLRQDLEPLPRNVIEVQNHPSQRIDSGSKSGANAHRYHRAEEIVGGTSKDVGEELV